MSKRVPQRAIVAVALSLLGACGFHAPVPERTAPPLTPEIPLSVLSATLTISTSKLAELLNDRTSEQIADFHNQTAKCGIGRCQLNLHAVRTGAITVATNDNRLLIGVPFSLNLEMKMHGALSFLGGHADAIGRAEAETSASLSPDWQIRTTTTGSIRLRNSHVRLGPLLMNVTDIWDGASGLISPALFKMLDKRIAAGLYEKPRIEQLWARSFTPIKIGKKPVSWLLLQPQQLRVGKVTIANDAVTLPLGIDVRASVIASDASPEVSATPLPRPGTLSQASNLFSFDVPILLTYESAAHLAMDALETKSPRVAGMTVRFRSIHILPSGDDVVVAAEFCADHDWDPLGWFSACGSGYFRGTPIFDPATQTIRVAKLHYDITTENVILGAARFLAGSSLSLELQQRLVFKLGVDIDKLKSQVRAAIAKPQGRDVTIYGTVTNFGPLSLAWTKDGFLASFLARGTVHAAVHI